jgi:hypothetical protein
MAKTVAVDRAKRPLSGRQRCGDLQLGKYWAGSFLQGDRRRALAQAIRTVD